VAPSPEELPVSAESLARWQFAITTVYHFLIVPLSIGLAFLVAGFQTAAYRTGKAHWDQAARFYGKLMIVSFAIGVATGIVQEFQFGMNWSTYSRFVGDVFGAPLAMEGLAAFFLESTFLGLWVFGRGKLSPRVHLATIWAVAVGTALSAYFILAANSWMQHPVGYRLNEETGRAELTSIWAVLTNSTQLVTFPHTMLGAWMTGGAVVLGFSAWHLRRSGDAFREMHRAVLRVGAVTVLASVVGVSLSGHVQGQLMTEQQPMKMAAAEALWRTTDHAPFSLFAVGDVSKGENKVDLTIPDGLSILAGNSPSTTVEGVVDVQADSVERFGPGSYVPVVWLAYWTFRLMIGLGVLAGLVSFLVLVQRRRGRLETGTRLLRVATVAALLPFRQRLRVGVHRDGPSALAGLRAVQDQRRGQHRRRQRPRPHHPDRLHAAVCRARRPRGAPVPPDRAQGPGGGPRPRGRPVARAGAGERPARTRPRLTLPSRQGAPCSTSSGSAPSPSSGPASCCSRASTSGSATCSPSWVARSRTAAWSSAPSGRPGTATRSGCWWRAARPSRPSRSGTPPSSAASTSPSPCCSSG
jgi:cytochrome d ubiquinol oxidase subunit I